MLTELLLEYRQLLPFAPPDVLDRVKALISPIQINFSIGTQISAIDVVDIWIASLDNTLNKDSFAWVYVLMLIRKASEKGHPLNRNLSHELSKRRSRSGRPLSSSGTWFEATRRLAANLFHVGRIGVPTDERARVLREAVSLLNFLISTDKAVSTPQTAKTYFGMRGVAYVLLGRNSEDRYEVYKQACEDLQKSRTFGNTGVEASCYLIEAQYHMYDIDRAEAHLDDAEEILNSITLDQSRDQIPWFASGEVNSRKGYACAARGDLGSALNHLEVAVESYRRTTLCAHDVRLSLDFLSMRYGQAALKLYTTRHELELSEDSDLLNLAIEKLPVGGESLPSALLIRSMNWRKMHKYGEMEADLIRARDALDGCSEEHDEFKQLNRPRCMAALCECSIQRAIERKDPSLAVEGLEHFLEFPVTLRDLSIVGPIYGIRFLLALDLPRYSDLAKKIAYNLRSRLAVSSENLESYRFGASHVSNILLTIATKLSDEHVVRVAYELSSSAVRRGDGAAPELIALAGEASLVLGKRTLARGDETGALDLFLEAGVFFENAIQIARSNGCSEAFSFRVAHSKAGEAYVRAHAFSGLEAHAVKAEHHLTSSRDLGNDAPELIGLLADIAYRRGSRNKNIADLMRALSLKENARIRGNNSRENRSVSSAAALTLWQLSSAIGDLTTAIQMALEASDRDPTWPWPLFQLAEIAHFDPEIRRESTEALLQTNLLPELVRAVRNGDFRRLTDIGSNLAIENKEFGRSEFGSRQPVYVLDDPHDLLNQTVVFKETKQEIAYREKSNVESFSAYLKRIDAPSWCKLPEPISIVTREEKAVYVMRRARGTQLGRAALQGAASPEILTAFRRSIRFLAHFHAWRMETEGPRFRDRRVVSKIVQNVLRLWALSGFKNNITLNDFDVIFPLIEADFPYVPKKDAHPENWLLDEENNIVMLDLESVGECPLFFELAQLMDDYPVFPVDDCGWNARLEQCEFYIDSLAEDGIDLSRNKADAPRLYEAFALLRASFGLARNQARAGKIPSAALRASMHRDAHYRALLDYLGQLPNSAISALARKIRACC